MKAIYNWFDGIDIKLLGVLTLKFRKPNVSFNTIAKKPSKVNKSIRISSGMKKLSLACQ